AARWWRCTGTSWAPRWRCPIRRSIYWKAWGRAPACCSASPAWHWPCGWSISMPVVSNPRGVLPVSQPKPNLSLDLRGEHCPYNAIATLETLETMLPGQLLEVVTDCSQSVQGIPEDAKLKGYNCLAVEQHGPLFRFLIEVPA